jgi:hypothetical protein
MLNVKIRNSINSYSFIFYKNNRCQENLFFWVELNLEKKVISDTLYPFF